MAMAGATSLVTLAGTLVCHNAEILAAILLGQFVNKGTPAIYGSSSTTMDLKTTATPVGCPEFAMINAPLLLMAHEYYHMPSRCMCGMTDAKVPDMQAGLETMQNVLMAVFAEVDIINECLGVLDAIMTVSYEKHIVDEEIIKRCLYMKPGVDLSDEAMSVDVIQEVGPGGTYLTHPDTFTHFKETFTN